MVRLSRSSILQTEELLPDPQPQTLPAEPVHLWMAICLPDLALTAVLAGKPALGAARPAAVYESVGGQLRIVATNDAARLIGIRPGLTVSAAMALTEAMELFERALIAEDQYLDALAGSLSQLTPMISLQAREGLLLEIGGSLKLFGGLPAIRRLLVAELRQHGLSFHIGTAPTPLAAVWAARYGGLDLSPRYALAGQLAGLPLAVTAWPERIQKRLLEMGVATLGACLRLPRSGFARRIGKTYLDDLDKATGKQPDPRRPHVRSGVLGWQTDFLQETVDKELLVRVLESGIEVVAADLARGQAQVKQLRLEFGYLREPPDIVECDFVEPVHLASQLLAPLAVRLDSLRLAGPVAALKLEAGPLLPMRSDPQMLFDSLSAAAAPPGAAAALVECLRGRFGRLGVCGLQVRADHRPELAFGRLTDELRFVAAREKQVSIRECERPLWLLPEPKRISSATLRALGRADFRMGPERIESGWWDGMDIRRDYYIVTTSAGQRWWLYRDCATHEWWLHGIFG